MQSLQQIIQDYKKTFHESEDFITREFIAFKNVNAVVMFVDGSVDKQFLISGVMRPLQNEEQQPNGNIADFASENLVGYVQSKTETDKQKIVEALLNGFCVVMFENCNTAVLADSTKWIVRIPSEPPTSAVMNGPREGFIEDIITNASLLRKRLKNPDFIMKKLIVGKYTQTQVRVCYIESIASPKVVKMVIDKISKIDIDGVVDSNYISEFLQNKRHTIFKQIGISEKPDIVTAKLLEGRIAIVVDGSPMVLTVPFCLLEDLQNSNDYYITSGRATVLRFLRIIGLVFAILLPGVYVALMVYHYNIIPLKFLISIANSIQGIPLPPFLEVLFIIFLFEMLYEASLRMPRYMGLALSVVGALILGDTAVKAGLVSPPAVMIVALTGVMSYTVPEQAQQISFLRLIFTIVGGIFGLFGIILASMFLVAYLANMDSYNTPYLSPFAPFNLKDQKDGILKMPAPAQRLRPKSIPNTNIKRQG
ncbi:MAG: spore germination protein [Clostridia bacterium]|nr:spore germination protein [Clostridia bacterium]